MRLDHLLSKEEKSRVTKTFGHDDSKKEGVLSLFGLLFNFEGAEDMGV